MAKNENMNKADYRGTDFNYVDEGYVTIIPHEVRINKRPLTANPREEFGDFTQSLFKFGHDSNE